ncbi:unnamed protein product [marine sediment metagenome]|uniref:Band 7 domain-containing protein n=1 Tax=marine sediment metagenome TaxID=412755 RepID=X0TCC3_9ZZZZ
MGEFPLPPHEPSGGNRWFKRVVVLVAVICIWQFGVKPIVDEHQQKNQWDIESPSKEEAKAGLLLPGFHIISSFPFVVTIGQGEVGIEDEDGVRKVPVTEIPAGHVGVITDRRSKYVHVKALKPGRYQVNPDLYEVDPIFTGNQTWHFGGAKDE